MTGAICTDQLKEEINSQGLETAARSVRNNNDAIKDVEH